MTPLEIARRRAVELALMATPQPMAIIPVPPGAPLLLRPLATARSQP